MHLISQAIDGLPAFYSIDVGRALGSPHAWTQERDRALQFARAQDAQAFVDVFLPNLAPFASIVSIQP